MTYKLYKDRLGLENAGVILDEKMAIPFDPANTDYQAYLKWVAEGNTPTPAENT
jgi:hypothetical protein